MQALVAIVVVGVLFYNLAPQLIKHRQQVTKTASIITARLALHSMVDFTLFGIRQRWCFSDAWMPEKCAENLISHPRAVERLLMKSEAVDYLRSIGIAQANNVPLKKISAKMDLSSFSSLHPVYKMVSELKGYKVESFAVSIERDMRGIVPEYGREVYLKVTVSLLDKEGKVIEVGSSPLSTTSYVGVYPREVGSFALMIAGDLRLDRSSATGLQVGDASFKMFGSRLERSRYQGLIFESPVFVNGSIHLPNGSSDSDDSVYSPVTFKEAVILGDGSVKRNGAEFRPQSAGGQADQFWSQVRQFGGFQKGVDIDGYRDLGLDYLSGKLSGGIHQDPGLLQACIENNLNKTDLRRTKGSQLHGVITATGPGKFNYRLGLTHNNRFSSQRGQVQSPRSVGQWWKNLLANWNVSSNTQPISKFNLKIGEMEVQGDLPLEGTVTLEPKIDLRPYEKVVERQVSAAEAEVQRVEQDLKRIERNINEAAGEIESTKGKIATETDAAKVAALNQQISELRSKIQSLEADKNKEQAKLQVAQDNVKASREKLAEVRHLMTLQPKVQLTVTSPKNSQGHSNPTFKDFQINFINGQALLNGMTGDPLSAQLNLEPYDVSYDRGHSLRPYWEIETKSQLVFTRNGAAFVPSQTLMDGFGRSRGQLPNVDPYLDMDKRCENLATDTPNAFAGATWNTSFAPYSRHSWSFTNRYDERTNYVFDANNAFKAPNGTGTATFLVKSLVKDCVIKESANFVTGFFNCQRLIIESRSQPLRIVGSFIVSNGVYIASDAYTAGIRWSTIYHPMATFELRQAGILKSSSGQSCDTIARFPVWHPYPSIKKVSDLYKCNALSLRAKADPFRWTSVDPDCGLVPSANGTLCKNRLVRYYVLEVARESGI